jgi:hypothetical protein
MIEIFHVSDLHFGKSGSQNDDANSLLKGINQRFPFNGNKDRYLLVTGDITQSGKEDEYALAGKALSPFAGRVFVTPGNHDYGSLLGTDYSEEKARYFDKWSAEVLKFTHPFFNKEVFVRPLTDQSNQAITMIGLNSCAKEGISDLAQGEIGEGQRKDLAEKLTQCDPRIPKLLFLHHIPNKEAEWALVMTLRDWKELMAVVRGKVDILAFGHQGRVMDVGLGLKAPSKPASAPIRPMQVRSAGAGSMHGVKAAGKRSLLLDADGSVGEQAFYRITLEGNTPKAEVVPVP